MPKPWPESLHVASNIGEYEPRGTTAARAPIHPTGPHWAALLLCFRQTSVHSRTSRGDGLMSAVHLTTWGRPRCRLYQCGPRSSGRQVTRYRVFAGYLNRLCIPSARRRSVARRAASLRRLSRTTLSVCGGRIANSCRPGILEQQARREKDLRPFLPSAFLEGSRGRGEAAGRRCFCQLLSPDLLCWPTTQSNMDRSFFPDQIMYGVDEGSPEICRCIVMDPPPPTSRLWFAWPMSSRSW